MTIQSKFEVGDLVNGIYDQQNIRYHILNITTETCNGGTQVFYTCRPFVWTVDYKEKGHWSMLQGLSNGTIVEYKHLREDEVQLWEEPLAENPDHSGSPTAWPSK